MRVPFRPCQTLSDQTSQHSFPHILVNHFKIRLRNVLGCFFYFLPQRRRDAEMGGAASCRAWPWKVVVDDTLQVTILAYQNLSKKSVIYTATNSIANTLYS